MSVINDPHVILENNQLYFVEETSLLKLNHHLIDTSEFPKQSVQIKPVVEFKIPKPPVSLLYDFFKLGAMVYNEHKSEVEAFIIWNTTTKKHYLKIPTQTVSSATCEFNWNERNADEIIVMDCHSHHTMSISFSSTDDHSDSPLGSLIPHISLVIKNIGSFSWLIPDSNVSIRISYRKKFIDVKIADVFEVDQLISIEDLNKVVKKPVVVPYSYSTFNTPNQQESKYDYWKNVNPKFKKPFDDNPRDLIRDVPISRQLSIVDEDLQYEYDYTVPKPLPRPLPKSKMDYLDFDNDMMKMVETLRLFVEQLVEKDTDEPIYTYHDAIGNGDLSTASLSEILDLYDVDAEMLTIQERNKLLEFIKETYNTIINKVSI